MKKAAFMLGLAAAMMPAPLPDYNFYNPKPTGSRKFRKAVLTNKQSKARAASKRAKKARRKNRR